MLVELLLYVLASKSGLQKEIAKTHNIEATHILEAKMMNTPIQHAKKA